MISWRTTILAGAVIGLACGGPTDMCGCPPVAPSATVFGRVQTAAGAPVTNALVLAYVAQAGDCGSRDYADGSAATRGDGTYTFGITGPESLEAVCEAPFDSARVDATLSAP